MITLVDICKRYSRGFIPKPVDVLKGISLTVEKGEVFGYLGPNGAGKTTTINILMNFIRTDSGSAHIKGVEVHKPEARKSVGYMPEQPYFYNYLTGSELLNYSGSLNGMDEVERKKKVTMLLERLGMQEHANKQLGKYSRGMLQRIGIAQSLINDPDLIILDEPLSGLDPLGRRDVLDLIIEQKQKGTTIFFSSHILSDAEKLCDRVGFINHGELIAEGKLNELKSTEAGSEKMEIAIESDTTPVDNLFKDGIKPEIELVSDRSYRIRFNGEHNLNPVIEALIQAKMAIRSVNRHEESLEELFIKKFIKND